MGIYDSGLSCWERNRLGLPADHAGEGVIPSPEKVELKPEKVAIEVPEPVVEEKVKKEPVKAKPVKKQKEKSLIKKTKDKFKGKK